MDIQQLSIFLENKPGQLLPPCKTLADAGFNIAAATLADTQQFGILRLIVPDWQKAKSVLEKAGCVVNAAVVTAVAVPNKPGGLAGVLEVIERAGISVEYMYAFPGQVGGQAVLIFRFEDPATAVNVLRSSHIKVVAGETLWPTAETAKAR